MTLGQRILVQVGALLPLILAVLVVLARQHTGFTTVEVLPPSAAVAFTSFLCVWIGLDGD